MVTSALNLACGTGSPQEASMAQDSDAFLDVVGVLVWLVVLMLALVIVVLQGPLPRQSVRL